MVLYLSLVLVKYIGMLSMEVTAQNIFSSKRLCLAVSGLVRRSSPSELLLVPKALAVICFLCALVPLAAIWIWAAWLLVVHHLLCFLQHPWEVCGSCCPCPGEALWVCSHLPSPARGSWCFCMPKGRGGREQCLLAPHLRHPHHPQL